MCRHKRRRVIWYFVDPTDDKRGFYIASPLIGVIFFVVTIAVAAFVYNEDMQNRIVAGTSGDQLAFTGQSIIADVTDVILQNELQIVLDEFVLGPSANLYQSINDAVAAALAGGDIYAKAYPKAPCEPWVSDPQVLTFFTRYPDAAGPRIINIDTSMEIKTYLLGYGLECKSAEQGSLMNATFSGRLYFLGASNICSQMPTLCWP